MLGRYSIWLGKSVVKVRFFDPGAVNTNPVTNFLIIFVNIEALIQKVSEVSSPVSDSLADDLLELSCRMLV